MNAAVVRAQVESALGERFPRALTLPQPVRPVTVSSGVAVLDAISGGIPRGALTEVTGPASSGRTGVLHRVLASISRSGEFCTLVDASDCFDPGSAESAGVQLDRVLWVRCGARPGKRKSSSLNMECVEQALRATDLLLQSGGFGLIALDLGNIPQESARRVPLTTWFRFRRAVEKTPAIFLVVERAANAKTCASLVLEMRAEEAIVTSMHSHLNAQNQGVKVGHHGDAVPAKQVSRIPSHAKLFQELRVTAAVARSISAKKPAQSAHFSAQRVSLSG